MVVEDNHIRRCPVCLGVSGKGRLGDGSKVSLRPLDTPPPLARGLDPLPSRPADLGRGIDIDRDIEQVPNIAAEREDALAHDQRPRLDPVCPDTPMGLEAPLGAVYTRQLPQRGEVLGQQIERSVAGLVSLGFGQGVVFRQVMIGREQHPADLPGEGGLARPDRPGDADDNGALVRAAA